jgi:hypothetical protein
MGSSEGISAQNDELDHYAQDGAGSPGRLLEGRSGRSLDPLQRAKVIEILSCCHDRGKNVELALLATSTSGLVDDEVRRLACMFATSHLKTPS